MLTLYGVGYEWMDMKHRQNSTGRGRQKYWERNLSKCHFVRHKSHMDRLGTERRPPQWTGRRLTAWALAQPAYLQLALQTVANQTERLAGTHCRSDGKTHSYIQQVYDLLAYRTLIHTATLWIWTYRHTVFRKLCLNKRHSTTQDTVEIRWVNMSTSNGKKSMFIMPRSHDWYIRQTFVMCRYWHVVGTVHLYEYRTRPITADGRYPSHISQ